MILLRLIKRKDIHRITPTFRPPNQSKSGSRSSSKKKEGPIESVDAIEQEWNRFIPKKETIN